MTGNDGHQEEGQIRKKCPFLGEWCIGEVCAFRTTLFRNVEGMQQQVSVCPVEAILIILSEINKKTPPSLQQKIQVPRQLFRG